MSTELVIVTKGYVEASKKKQLKRLDFTICVTPSGSKITQDYLLGLELTEDRLHILSNKLTAYNIGDIPFPQGYNYSDSETGEPKSYVSLYAMRGKIEQVINKASEGKYPKIKMSTWNTLIDVLNIGSKNADDGSYETYPDLEECFLALSKDGSKRGFNALCWDKFVSTYKAQLVKYMEEAETILQEEDELEEVDKKHKAMMKRRKAKIDRRKRALNVTEGGDEDE